MGFLIRLFSKNGLFLFFLFLQIIAVTLIFSRNSMQQSFIAAQTTAFNAWVSGYIDEGTSYLKLKQINEELVAQNKTLMQELYGKEKIKNPNSKVSRRCCNFKFLETKLNQFILNQEKSEQNF